MAHSPMVVPPFLLTSRTEAAWISTDLSGISILILKRCKLPQNHLGTRKPTVHNQMILIFTKERLIRFVINTLLAVCQLHLFLQVLALWVIQKGELKSSKIIMQRCIRSKCLRLTSVTSIKELNCLIIRFSLVPNSEVSSAKRCSRKKYISHKKSTTSRNPEFLCQSTRKRIFSSRVSEVSLITFQVSTKLKLITTPRSVSRHQRTNRYIEVIKWIRKFEWYHPNFKWTIRKWHEENN